MNTLNRRGLLAAGAAGMAGGILAGVSPSPTRAADTSVKPIRIGVIGTGGRGRWHITNLLTHQEAVDIPAVCDVKPAALKAAVDTVKKIRGKEPATYGKDDYDYRNLLGRDDLDGVVVATDCQWLGLISIDALKAGKSIGSEVTGTHTMDECWGLVKAKESSGSRYMLLENASYGRETLLILNMIRQGVFGEPYFATGSYIHDCRKQYFDSSGKLTWRGRLMRDNYGSNYPCHAIGSPAKWLGINDGDRLVSCSAMMSTPRGLHTGAVARFGADSPAAKVDFKNGDFTTVLIKTAQGKQLRIDSGFSATRPYHRYYLLQGMKGCYDSRAGIYLGAGGPSGHKWEKLDKYAQEYEHPYYRKDSETAKRAGGHGGLDYFCMRDFVAMVRDDKEPWIDVYDVAAWTAVMHCSRVSIDQKGAPVEIPDFTGGKWKDPDWRRGRTV